jgi:starch synthase
MRRGRPGGGQGASSQQDLSGTGLKNDPRGLYMFSQCDRTPRRTIGKIVHVCREYASLAGAGGMKDVTEGLAKASAAAGIDTHVFLPYYRTIQAMQDIHAEETARFPVPMNYPQEKRSESVTMYRVQMEENLTIHLVKTERYEYLAEGPGTIERRGIYQYTEEESRALARPELKDKGYFDFFAMNVVLVKSVLYALGGMDRKPDVIHCHDGHAALLPLIAQTSQEGFDHSLGHVPSVLTIHNAGTGYHQEVANFDFAATLCGVPLYVAEGCRLDDKFDPLLAGGVFGQSVNTVSENYARELQYSGQDALTGWLGHAFLARGIKLEGITNGVDPDAFDPRNAERLGLAAPFNPVRGDFEGKELCKKSLLESLSRGESSKNATLHGRVSCDTAAPLLTFVSRLGPQKGMDILVDALGGLLARHPDVQLVGLGSGDPVVEGRFRRLADSFAGRVCVAFGFSPSLAQRVYAAGDFFLIPSRYEPCGLTDFYAQLAGNVPIVHRVGGLVKTIDNKFGFSYLGGKRELSDAIARALTIYKEQGKTTLRRIQSEAAKNVYENFTWEKVLSRKYLPLYGEAIERAEPVLPY